MKKFSTSLWQRLKPLGDLSAWVLLILSILPLILLSPSMLATLVTWTCFGLALVGISVMLCRLVLPHVELSEFLGRALNGNLAAAIVASAVILYLGVLFLGLVIWAKA